MYYIYSLSFNGIPFYVGMTNNPVMRYRGHYYWTDCKTYNYIRFNLRAYNKYADMKVICKCETKDEALFIESRTINFLWRAGFLLLNKDHNNADIRQYPPIYTHYKKLPYRWFTSKIKNNIITQSNNAIFINNYTWQTFRQQHG